MIEEIKEYFIKISDRYFEKTGYNYWNNHVKHVVDISLQLAEKCGADKEIVEIAAILHDVAKPLEKRENESHNIVGSDIAKEKLKSLNYDEFKTNIVCECILNHSGNISKDELSKEVWCVRNADIISLIYNVTIFYYLAYREYNFSYEEGRKYIKNKIKEKMLGLDEKLYEEYKCIFETLLNSI